MKELETRASLASVQLSAPLPWVRTEKHCPYLLTEDGQAWMPIGQNDAICWPDLAGLYGRRDMAAAESYLRLLADHGVGCLHLMLEYCEGAYRHFEDPVGHVQPKMVQLWDDLFALCEKYGLRILLTPFDTFWMWLRWDHHPYNRVNGGPCDKRSQFMSSLETRAAIKKRLAFVTERWGKSGVLFGWDLMNEIHPAFAEDDAAHLYGFIQDVGGFLRSLEIELYGRAHPQTVSAFGPLIVEGFRPQVFTIFTPVIIQDPQIGECVYRHPTLDFTSVHFYEEGTIDDPHNTVDPAIAIGKLVRQALRQIPDGRPLVDSEYGPIHSYKDHHTTLPAPFDDEYFRHCQWAHLASGEASGGMRWPNRRPHTLTPGMRAAQAAMARFLPLIDWRHLHRHNWNQELEVSTRALEGFACGDDDQAVVWLLRTDHVGPDGRLARDVSSIAPTIRVPGLGEGAFRVTAWDSLAGCALEQFQVDNSASDGLTIHIPTIVTDLALAIRRIV